MRGQLNLHTGQPAVAADILAAGTRLLTGLQDGGYAFAKVDAPVATNCSGLARAGCDLFMSRQARWRASAPSASRDCSAPGCSAVLSRLELHAGDQYSAAGAGPGAQQSAGHGRLRQRRCQRRHRSRTPNGAVPVTFRVTERKRHAVVIECRLFQRSGRQWRGHLDGSQSVRQCRTAGPGRLDHQPERQCHQRRWL